MAKPPSEIWLFRILHVDNVAYALRHGLFTRNHPHQDPNYIFIGDGALTSIRHDAPIPLPNAGALGDYVPFYFWPLSPMLLNIKTGWRGITQRPQRDIVYLCCRLVDVQAHPRPVVFTDGHATARTSRFFQDPADIDQLDWPTIRLRYWTDEEDNDRQRRKQAECLVKEYVAPECISRIIVFDEAQRTFVSGLLKAAGHSAALEVNPDNFYFHE
ncbi:MAG TPA: DUF4433 domain-containing protein [Hymenobacter sp.]